jgi:NAD(P)-dependent dehydrogenase (short-subunit alcohol dehydrogenase family)
MEDIKGKVAVVTGGARGIGEATAALLAEGGARVVILDRDEKVGAETARRLGGASYALDVTDAEATEAVAERIEREVGPVGLLLTAAGITQAPVPPEELSIAQWRNVIDVDLTGTWLSCLAFGKRMAKRGEGSICTIASIIGLRSAPLHAYGPAKAGVISLTQNLASEWGPFGVRVNTVAPGYTRTPLLQAEIDAGRRDPARLEASAALQRMIEPVEVARAIRFLLSDDASAITGVCLPIDAGWLTAGSWQSYGGLRGANR